MKDSVKGIIWMVVVLLFTAVWDVAYVVSMKIFISDSKDLFTCVVFCAGFTALTIPWNFVAIRGFRDALERYKLEKKDDEPGK